MVKVAAGGDRELEKRISGFSHDSVNSACVSRHGSYHARHGRDDIAKSTPIRRYDDRAPDVSTCLRRALTIYHTACLSGDTAYRAMSIAIRIYNATSNDSILRNALQDGQRHRPWRRDGITTNWKQSKDV